MALSDKDKLEARDALAMALELNEPETMIEGLRRLCAKRLETAHMSVQERDRWQAAIDALASVAAELEAANKPKARDNGAQGEQAPQAAP
jgi:hypothetical protein